MSFSDFEELLLCEFLNSPVFLSQEFQVLCLTANSPSLGNTTSNQQLKPPCSVFTGQQLGTFVVLCQICMWNVSSMLIKTGKTLFCSHATNHSWVQSTTSIFYRVHIPLPWNYTQFWRHRLAVYLGRPRLLWANPQHFVDVVEIGVLGHQKDNFWDSKTLKDKSVRGFRWWRGLAYSLRDFNWLGFDTASSLTNQ